MTKYTGTMASWLMGSFEQLVLQGIDRKALAAGMDVADLQRENAAPQFQLYLSRRLWHRAVELSDDPMLGLKVGASLPLQAMNFIPLLAIHSPNLRAAIMHTVRYQHLISNAGLFHVLPQPDGIVLHYIVNEGSVAMHHFQIESLLAAWFCLLKSCSSSLKFKPQHISLTSPLIHQQTAYERFFQCPVTVGASATTVSFADDLLDTPYHGADPALLALVQRHAESLQQAHKRSDSLINTIKATITSHGFADISCAKVANSLDLSERTLQRRLTEARTTFSTLTDNARMEHARTLLRTTDMPISDICEVLGYSEPSSLSHAVKSYWGVSPRQLRLNAVDQVDLEGES